MVAEMGHIVKAARRSRKLALTGADSHRTRQLPLQLALVVGIVRSCIVRVKRKLVPLGQIPQDVVRANVAAILDGQELIGFDPENFHSRI